MIKSLTVVNYLGKSLTITLTEAEPSHGLLLKSITGIGPSDAVLNYSDYATNDGSEFNSARLDKRSIQIMFMLIATDDATVEDARHYTYKYFPTKKIVKLIFETDTRTIYCTGRVEHNTPDIFQEKETVTIDIICEDPYFHKYTIYGDEEVVEYEIVSPNFSSEYLNPDDSSDEELETFYTEEDVPSIETGIYNSTGIITKDIVNSGDTETGFKVEININGPIEGDIAIANANNDIILIDISVIESMIGSSVAAGDVIQLSTESSKRYLNFIRNGNKYNVLNALDFENLTWLYLNPGDNLISYYVTEGNDYTTAKFSYKSLYLGV